MKTTTLLTALTATAALAAGSAHATLINLSDLIQTPTANATQQNDVATPNGGVINDNVNGTLAYYVTTYTFGTNSQAHIKTFWELSAGQDRVGVQVQDTGFVDFTGTGDPGRTNFDIDPLGGGLQAGEMAGQTVTLLVRQYWHSTNDGLRATLGTSDDILFNVWVNPTGSATETSVSPGDTNMLADGDLQTLWNASDFFFLTQDISNQGTPGDAGANSITNTKVFTGTDATFANALAAATIPEPSSLALLGLGGLLVASRRRRG